MGNDPILTLSQSVVLNLYTMVTINIVMSIKSADESVEHLYNQVRGTEYKPSAFWTTAQKFSPKYTTVKTEFVLEELKQMVPPKGIKPLFPRS